MAPLLPKLRGHFAEFLNQSYLDHLRIFVLTYLCWFAVRTDKQLTFRDYFLAVFRELLPLNAARIRTLIIDWRIYLPILSICLNLDFQHQTSHYYRVIPSLCLSGSRILTAFPSATPFGLTLGVD